MTVKYTAIFDYFSGFDLNNPIPVRIGGWSESYYAAARTPAQDALWIGLLTARVGICPLGVFVTKWRVQTVDPAGPSQLKKASLAAPATWQSDVPQMALKIQFGGGGGDSAFIREFRGIPDVMVTKGEYSPTAPFTANLQNFLAVLQAGTWQNRRRDKTLPRADILSISPAGVVVMQDALAGAALGLPVQVMRTVSPSTGRRFGYMAKITAFTDDKHFTISSPKVRESGYGTMREASTYTPAFAGADIDGAQVVVRKVGRVFRSYSGRASKRA